MDSYLCGTMDSIDGIGVFIEEECIVVKFNIGVGVRGLFIGVGILGGFGILYVRVYKSRYGFREG